MNRRKEILEELKDAAPTLAGNDFQHPYRVPAGYFESLADNIILRIRLENTESVQDELEIISPLLNRINKNMPFSTPEGYFDTLTQGIRVAKDAEEYKPARVVKMFQPRKTFRLAAAAVTIGVIGIAAWLFMREPASDLYATKPDTEVHKELKNKVDEITETELSNFIQSSNLLSSYDSTSPDEINEDDVKLMLADIPDYELEKFIDQHSAKEKFN